MFLQKHTRESVKKKRIRSYVFQCSNLLLLHNCSIILLVIVVTSINTNFLFGILSSGNFCVKLHIIGTTSTTHSSH